MLEWRFVSFASKPLFIKTHILQVLAEGLTFGNPFLVVPFFVPLLPLLKQNESTV